MADIRAIANGNWSNPAIWNTGVLPTSTSIVRPNNFIVTMDVNTTVAEIRNDAGGGAVAGGRFIINSGVSVTATTITVGVSNVRLITHSGIGTASITGTITGQGSLSQMFAIENLSSGTLNINGNIVFPFSNTSSTLEAFITNASNGIINITGTVNGNTLGFNRCQCVLNASVGTINIVGNVNSPVAAGALFFTVVNISTGTITINGNINSTAATTIDNRSSGTVTIGGNCTAIDSTILTNVSGIVIITGDIAQNSTIGTRTAISNTGIGTISIVGNLTASNSALNNNFIAISNSGSGIINVTGIISAGTGSASNSVSRIIDNTSNGIVNITGTINGTSSSVSTSGVNAVRNAGSGTINFTGNVNGNSNSLAVNSALFNLALGIINISGNAIGGSTGLAVGNAGTGTINLNGNAIGGTGWFAIEGVSSAGNTIIEKAIYSNLGQSPITGYIKFKTTNPEIDVLRTDNVIVTLRDPLNVSGLLPATNNVRSGTTYNTGSSTGTLAMPAANLVQLGVPVDNTVGTGNLTPADFWNYLISNGFTNGSIGERLKNASTVDTTGAQVAGFII